MGQVGRQIHGGLAFIYERSSSIDVRLAINGLLLSSPTSPNTCQTTSVTISTPSPPTSIPPPEAQKLRILFSLLYLLPESNACATALNRTRWMGMAALLACAKLPAYFLGIYVCPKSLINNFLQDVKPQESHSCSICPIDNSSQLHI